MYRKCHEQQRGVCLVFWGEWGTAHSCLIGYNKTAVANTALLKARITAALYLHAVTLL
jgi:hypothetical protein